jgi:hypothetical protein
VPLPKGYVNRLGGALNRSALSIFCQVHLGASSVPRLFSLFGSVPTSYSGSVPAAGLSCTIPLSYIAAAIHTHRPLHRSNSSGSPLDPSRLWIRPVDPSNLLGPPSHLNSLTPQLDPSNPSGSAQSSQLTLIRPASLTWLCPASLNWICIQPLGLSQLSPFPPRVPHPLLPFWSLLWLSLSLLLRLPLVRAPKKGESVRPLRLVPASLTRQSSYSSMCP